MLRAALRSYSLHSIRFSRKQYLPERNTNGPICKIDGSENSYVFQFALRREQEKSTTVDVKSCAYEQVSQRETRVYIKDF